VVDAFTAKDVRVYRGVAALAAAAVLGYGGVYAVVLPGATDPWLHRVLVAAACLALAAAPWSPGRPAFRVALYAVAAIITAWVVDLLRVNAFVGEYAIGLLMIVSITGAVIRSPRALAAYGAATVAGVAAVGAATPAPRLSPPLFASNLATVLVVLLLVAVARRRAAIGLAASEARYRLLFDASPRPLWVYDVATRAMLAVNDAALRQYGYSRDEFLALAPGDLHADGAPPGADAPAPAGDGAPPDVSRHRRRDGAAFDVEAASHPIDWDGRPARLVLAADVTARTRLEAELTRQALHDPLTGLGNRTLFRARVEAALARAAREGGAAGGAGVAVLFLDLDNFKTVNDSLGHGAGDALLTAVARRLLSATRGCDAVARLGGDEFAVLLDAVRDPSEAVVVAERVLDALRRPVVLDGAEVAAPASVGIATSAHADTAEALLRDADVAMYQAKAQGRANYRLFEPAMHAAALTRLQLEGELRRAVEQLLAPAGPGDAPDAGPGAFGVLYQPIVALATGEVRGVEALVRWHHPERGVVPPGQFMPLAEETGMVVPLGRWVLREACRQVGVWRRAHRGAAGLRVAVNVAERQLRDPGLVDDVRAALVAAALPAGALLLEITEGALMQEPAQAARTLADLRELGVRVAVDDFGTGYSSLGYLQQFPVDVLKIDRAFVAALGAGVANGAAGARPPGRPGVDDAALVRAIVHLGHTLALETVAEGIEDAGQAAALRALGCSLGQGYLFARPLEPAGILPLLGPA
jgi:diguanylate cyclase (GGDEF)-like protein/PAS domain S-box-containing protein